MSINVMSFINNSAALNKRLSLSSTAYLQLCFALWLIIVALGTPAALAVSVDSGPIATDPSTFIPTAAALDHVPTALQKKQQALYLQTLNAIRKGHKTNSKKGLQQLRDYPLYPYLLQAQLIKDLRKLPFEQVDQFLTEYANTVAAQQLRRRWLLTLGGKKRWQDFLRYYQSEVAGNKLNCLRLEALHGGGFSALALSETKGYWLSKKSMPKSCDPAFARWEKAGLKTDALVWQRMQLALDAKNTLLARYLGKNASAELKPYGRRLLSVYRNPRRLTTTADFTEQSDYNRDIVSYGLQRLAARDFRQASDFWVFYTGRLQFSALQQGAIRDKIARQVIASGEEQALDWLIVHDPNAEDVYLLQWRIRLALRQQKWSQSRLWISLLPAPERTSPRWRYWLARAHQQLNPQSQEAMVLLSKLALERNYYGFLAADLLAIDYGFNHQSETIPADNDISRQPAIQRSQQFLRQENWVAARREWNSAIGALDQTQLMAATDLAHRWQWHQQAILTTIKADKWNDLTIRFPLAFRQEMMVSATDATIRPEWMYAIARQESAFAIDAYSSAGARGLFQLLPTTARRVANNMGMPFTTQDLFTADKNITLGSNYLKQLLGDFNGNHILATAAYNAGPHRVRKWLKRQQISLPHDIWIETLPYHETRNYVQNVLAFSVIYGYRLGSNSPLIGNLENTIGTSIP